MQESLVDVQQHWSVTSRSAPVSDITSSWSPFLTTVPHHVVNCYKHCNHFYLHQHLKSEWSDMLNCQLQIWHNECALKVTFLLRWKNSEANSGFQESFDHHDISDYIMFTVYTVDSAGVQQDCGWNTQKLFFFKQQGWVFKTLLDASTNRVCTTSIMWMEAFGHINCHQIPQACGVAIPSNISVASRDTELPFSVTYIMLALGVVAAAVVGQRLCWLAASKTILRVFCSRSGYRKD